MNIRALKSGVRALLVSGVLFILVLQIVQQLDVNTSWLQLIVTCFFIPSLISAIVEVARAVFLENFPNAPSNEAIA